jgi:hypothetical protein
MSMPLNPQEGDDDVYPPDLLQENIDNFYALPITTAFEKALVNPRRCEVDVVNGQLADISFLLTDVRNKIALNPLLDPADYDDDLDYIDIVPETDETMDELGDHTDRVTSNLPSLIGIAQTALGLASAMFALTNPCLGIPDFFGSLMDKGKASMHDLSTRLSDLKNKLSHMADIVQNAIKSAVDALVAEAKQIASGIKSGLLAIKNMVAAEAKKFAKALIDGLRSGLASLLALLPKDPCLKSLLGSVATGGLAAIL